MKRRLLGTAAVCAGLVLASFAENGVGQSGGGWTQPMTPWGEPDLQGMWPIQHLIGTPFQRPEQFGERRRMNDEEYAAVLERVAQRNTAYDQEIASNRMGGGHWAEPTDALRLTSLLVDPPNGRLPELQQAAK
jgi:hypothetical protein